jgi:hypothetical protein
MTLPNTGVIVGRINTDIDSILMPPRIETVFNSISNYFPQRTQHMNESMSYIPNKKFMIDGQLEVSGDILVAGKSLMEHIEYANKELVNENQDLKKRVEELERLVNMLWYAPGMPGCEESKMDFDSVLETLPLDDNNSKN